jgi:hypothetical protein
LRLAETNTADSVPNGKKRTDWTFKAETAGNHEVCRTQLALRW